MARVSFYRCYFLNDVRRIQHVDVVEFPDDVSAARAAGDLLATRNVGRPVSLAAIEIWHGARLVFVHPPDEVGRDHRAALG